MPFDVTESQYNRIIARLTALEESYNNLATAISTFVTLTQVNQLLVVNTADIEDLKSQVEALENRVTSIEEEPLS